MSSFDLISMAIRNLWKRKLRTFLTVLGVVIGTASIVVMISVGIGMNEGYKEQIEQMGSLNVISVYEPHSFEANGNSKNVVLDNKALETFRNIDGVEVVTPVKEMSLKLVSGRYASDIYVQGILPETMEAMGYKISEGRFLQEGDGLNIVLGSYVLESFYNPKLSWQYRWRNTNSITIDWENDKFEFTTDYNYGTSSADKSIKAKKIEVIGVLDSLGESWDCVMPLSQVEKLLAEKEKQDKTSGNNNTKKNGTYEMVKIKVADLNNVTPIQDKINDMGYQTSSLKESLNAMQSTSKMLQMVLGAIGAVSLLVAAIGITNTMVMSIYERTREIGVMKVIGATLPDIKRLFLTEAAFIGFMGGLVGAALSYLTSILVNYIGINYAGQTSNLSLIPPWLAFLGIGFATVIGILSGYFPARRAMNLSALSAIKTE